MNRTTKRMALPIGAALILGSSGFAYMATSVVDESFAGQGTGDVSGYHVYDVHFPGGPSPYLDLVNLGANRVGESQNGITKVAFKVSPDNAGFSAVQVYNGNGAVIGGGGASNCSREASSAIWTCTVTSTRGLPAVPVTQIEYLDIENVDTTP